MSLIRREGSLLLVVDVQEGFYPPARTDVDRAAFEAYLDRVAWVAGIAAGLAVPAVVTEEDPDKNGHSSARVLARVPAGASVLVKPVFGAGDNPPILAAIERATPATVVLCGMETDVCIAHSALTLAGRGFRVVGVRDALFSPGDAHRHGVDRLLANGIELLSAKEIFYDWTRELTAVRDFVREHPELAEPPGFSL